MLVRMPVNPIHPDSYRVATSAIQHDPYFYYLYILRAHMFAHWGFDGLAIGDAYKTLLLIDEVEDEAGEYHDQALEADKCHLLSNRSGFYAFANQSLPTWILQLPGSVSSWKSLDGSRLLAYRLLIYLLTNIGCLRNAWDFYVQLKAKEKDESIHQELKSHLLRQVRTAIGMTTLAEEELNVVPEELPDKGFVQRVLYPWNTHEPERYDESNLRDLNTALALVAPKLRAEITRLPVLSVGGVLKYERQLGLVAVEDIAPGEEILSETSSLTANNRLYDPLCDACSGELPKVKIGDRIFSCSECDDTIFCSEACFVGAMETYHPAICASDAETIARDPPPQEAADALYFLLVARAFAFSAQQDRHPLELKETRFLWGEFVEPTMATSSPSEPVEVNSDAIFSHNPTLPFSFKYNILYPIHYLEKMEVNIYESIDQYDFWIFETLFSKFRGVASGKVSAKGVPEVSAVHPLWCLANHSCSPNVRWEWSGNMQFWARTQDRLVRWGGETNPQAQAGIKKGSDILSHYCDIDLNVEERREWARGALGGDCRCVRCLWESGEGNSLPHPG